VRVGPRPGATHCRPLRSTIVPRCLGAGRPGCRRRSGITGERAEGGGAEVDRYPHLQSVQIIFTASGAARRFFEQAKRRKVGILAQCRWRVGYGRGS
jgi:hypothetical protein